MKVLLLASALLLLIAPVIRWFARRKADALGLPGELIYVDQGDRELLVSDRYGLVGRPDYILKDGGELVPVERKSRAVSRSGPHDGEILQLAAYCLLVEEHFKKAVLRGQLQYRNRSIDVPFDDQLRRRLSNALDAMHEADELRDVPRSHDSPARCRGCGHRSTCNQSLA